MDGLKAAISRATDVLLDVLYELVKYPYYVLRCFARPLTYILVFVMMTLPLHLIRITAPYDLTLPALDYSTSAVRLIIEGPFQYLSVN
jgi:hypothetical protein